jgi:hypothetical protein
MSPVDRPPSDNLAAEPAHCPACGLKHVRQPDWLCPRCGTPVETEAYRSTMREPAPAAEPEREQGFPMGSVVAGAVLVLTSLVLAIGFARNPVVEHRWPLVAAMALLLLLGLELLLGVSPVRWVAIGLALIALILVAEDQLRARLPELMADPLPPALRVALQGPIRALQPLRLPLAAGLLGGTLLLVAGRPRRGRIAAGVLLSAPLALAEIVRWIAP